MARTTDEIAAEMVDREAIRDCLARYCRGIDRCDAELLRSVYWPDGGDHHTGFDAPIGIEHFIEWSMPRIAEFEDCVHMLCHSLIELDGARARVETYFWSVVVMPGEGRRQVMTVGRYLDRFERRGNEWRIFERQVAHDWYEERENCADWAIGPFGAANPLRGTAFADDPSRTWLGL